MNQTYFNGDFYQCVADTNPGESPASAPAKWRKIRIPAEWRKVLKKLTYAELLELDGQTDKAKLHRDTAEAQLDDLVREAANQEVDGRHGTVHSPQGQTVAASVILDDAFGLMRWEPDDLEDSQKADGRRSISSALQQVWDAWWWEALMLLEQQALRAPYVNTEFHAQGTEWYLPMNGKYYLAIQPSIGIPPLTAGVLNSGFWAEAQRCYSGSDVDNTLAYDWGSVVRNPEDGLFYQRGGSLQVSGTNASFANQNYQVHATANLGGRVVYWPGNAPLGDYNEASRFSASGAWTFTVIDDSPAVIATYFGSSNPVPGTPDVDTGWTAFLGSLPGPTFTRSFVAPAPPDTGHWGLLVPFDPVLTIATKVRQVSHQHPQLTHNPRPYRLEPVNGGVRVPEWCHGLAWVWSRRVTPILTGNEFDDATTYEATDSREIVFDA